MGVCCFEGTSLQAGLFPLGFTMGTAKKGDGPHQRTPDRCELSSLTQVEALAHPQRATFRQGFFRALEVLPGHEGVPRLIFVDGQLGCHLIRAKHWHPRLVLF